MMSISMHSGEGFTNVDIFLKSRKSFSKLRPIMDEVYAREFYDVGYLRLEGALIMVFGPVEENKDEESSVAF